MAANENTNIFPRNRVLTTLMVVNALLFGLWGIISISSGKALLSMIWFGGAVLFYINFLWSKKTPYIQLSEEGLTFNHAMAQPKRTVSYGTIASVQRVSGLKAYLLLKNGKRVKMGMYSLNKEDRIPLLHRIDKELTNNATV